jgi:hypothetical protein
MGTTNNNKAYRRFTTTEGQLRLLVDTTSAHVHTTLPDGSRFLQPVPAVISGSPTNRNILLRLDGCLSSGRRCSVFENLAPVSEWILRRREMYLFDATRKQSKKA